MTPYDLSYNPGAPSSITLTSTKKKSIFKKVLLTSSADIVFLLLRPRQCIDSQEFSSKTFAVPTIPNGLIEKNTHREFLRSRGIILAIMESSSLILP
jgi:hypothetical protein